MIIDKAVINMLLTNTLVYRYIYLYLLINVDGMIKRSEKKVDIKTGNPK